MSYQQPGYGPQDQVPQQWQQPPAQPYQQPQQPYYGGAPAYQQPVVVNVTQNAGGPVVVPKRINHFLHWVLVFFTGGLWLFVYVPLLMKRPKVVVYR